MERGGWAVRGTGSIRETKKEGGIFRVFLCGTDGNRDKFNSVG